MGLVKSNYVISYRNLNCNQSTEGLACRSQNENCESMFSGSIPGWSELDDGGRFSCFPNTKMMIRTTIPSEVHTEDIPLTTISLKLIVFFYKTLPPELRF